MTLVKNRPRVFLSHSKEDIDFVQRIYDDLRLCQIEPWLDSVEIRHGQPWLDAIFEGGIPTCDCVLIYLTDNSLKSGIVKKEIDAGILQKLSDSNVGFLPYVSNSSIRANLRSDIQSLQVPVWNEENYSELLARVVAEIWHSYYERSLGVATNEERVKRLEAELELEKLRRPDGGGIFTTVEDKDFAYIHESLNREEEVCCVAYHRPEGQNRKELGNYKFQVNALSLLLSELEGGAIIYDDTYLNYRLNENLNKVLRETHGLPEDISLGCKDFPELLDRLLMFGLIHQESYVASERALEFVPGGERPYVQRTKYHYSFTSKIHRFRYWLAFNDIQPEGIQVVLIDAIEEEQN